MEFLKINMSSDTVRRDLAIAEASIEAVEKERSMMYEKLEDTAHHKSRSDSKYVIKNINEVTILLVVAILVISYYYSFLYLLSLIIIIPVNLALVKNQKIALSEDEELTNSIRKIAEEDPNKRKCEYCNQYIDAKIPFCSNCGK